MTTLRKIILVVLILLFFIFGGILVLSFFDGITGRAILDDYIYTRAFCEGLVCEDYFVVCDGKNFVERILIEGSLILHEEGWEDFRIGSDSLCCDVLLIWYCFHKKLRRRRCRNSYGVGFVFVGDVVFAVRHVVRFFG